VGSASGPFSCSPADDGFGSVLATELKEPFGSIVFCDDTSGSDFCPHAPSSLFSGLFENLLISLSVRASAVCCSRRAVGGGDDTVDRLGLENLLGRGRTCSLSNGTSA
jgi:hypothetical protein